MWVGMSWLSVMYKLGRSGGVNEVLEERKGSRS